jgi:hypothetical protein
MTVSGVVTRPMAGGPSCHAANVPVHPAGEYNAASSIPFGYPNEAVRCGWDLLPRSDKNATDPHLRWLAESIC